MKQALVTKIIDRLENENPKTFFAENYSMEWNAFDSEQEGLNWLEERKSSFKKDFLKNAQEIEGKLKIWRRMTIEDPKAYLQSAKDIGCHWSWKKDIRTDELLYRDGELLLFEALLPDLNGVDIDFTAAHNLGNMNIDEHEIALKKGCEIILIKVYNSAGKVLYSNELPTFRKKVYAKYSVRASDYTSPRDPIKEKIDWSYSYREADLNDAKSYLSSEIKHINSPVNLKFLGYEEVFPWEIEVKTRTGEIEPIASKATFGWGKKLPFKKMDKQFYKKHDRYLIGLWEDVISPAIVINGVIGDGMGRTLSANALGQKVKIAKFQTDE